MSFNKAKALKTASKYVQQGKYQAAIEEYRKIIQVEPSDITTLNTLGDLYVKAGHTDEAIESFVSIAEHYRTSGFNLKAIAMFKKVSKLDPANIEIALKLAGLYAQQKLMVDARHQYLAVAEHYLRAGQNKQALGIYQKIADLDPENTTIQLKLAEAYLREQQPDQAYDAFVAAASELQRQNKHEEALQTYLKALKTRPEGQVALSAAVNLYTLRGEAQRAAALINHLLEGRPDDAELLILLGRVHQSANEMDEAEQAIARAVELHPAHFQYLLDLASFFARNEELARALNLFDRIIETLHERREEEKGIALLHEVIARDANHFGALERLAAIYARIREDHNLIETLNTLADAAIRKGEDQVAIQALQQLIQLEPDEIKHRRRLRGLGLSDEEMQRLHTPALAEAEAQPAVSPAITQRLHEFEVTHAQPAAHWGEAPTSEFEIQLEAPIEPAATEATAADGYGEFEVALRSGEPSYDFSFSDEEMVDGTEGGAAAWVQPGQEEAAGFEAITAEIDLSDELLASSSQSFLESYLAEEDEMAHPYSLQEPVGGIAFDAPASAETAPVYDAAPDEARLRDEIESIDFYLSQGMLDIAEQTLAALAEQFPAHPEIETARARLAAAEAAARQFATPFACRTGALEAAAPGEPETETIFIIPALPPEAAEAAPPSNLSNEADGFVSAAPLPAPATSEEAAELPPPAPTEADALTTLSSKARAASAGSPLDELLSELDDDSCGLDEAQGPGFEPDEALAASPGLASSGNTKLLDILDEFKSGADQTAGVEDYESHYNLGLAYKEMEMFDEAIEEFQQAFKATSAQDTSPNYLLCCSLLGFCFMQKELPRLAAMWFKKGLDAPGRTEDEYQALRYDLALAYTSLGELERAYETFSEVYAIDVNYRGVMAKMREVEEQMPQKQ
jgi:tetratricopeptide (TPR) repeat protein